uniref:Gustatory receptor n=1 Tax=Strigamia maritima TaxID=126957 RepID=T1JPC3_STRMM
MQIYSLVTLLSLSTIHELTNRSQLLKKIIMQVHRLESNVDATTSKINRFWRYFYKVYGLQISDDYVTKTGKCHFAFFTISQILINALMTSLLAFFVVTDNSITNICGLISVFTYWIQSSVCLIVLYKRQNQFFNCLNQLLQNITADKKKRAWKFLLRIMFVSIVVIVIGCIGELTYDFTELIEYDYLRYASKFITVYYWFAVILNETSKVLFIFVCILLSYNIECLMIDMERNMMSFRFCTEKIVINYHYKFYRNIYLINEVNKLFDLVLAAWIAGDVILICVVLRYIIANQILASFSSIYLMRVITFLLAMYTYGSLVKEKAHAAAIAITKLTDSQVNYYDTQVFNFRSQKKVNNWNCHLFMYDLSLSSVGINVSGYFIMSKGSILALVGTLITYVVIILQTN